MDCGSRRASTRLAWWLFAAGSIGLVASLGLRVVNGRPTSPSDITQPLAFSRSAWLVPRWLTTPAISGMTRDRQTGGWDGDDPRLPPTVLRGRLDSVFVSLTLRRSSRRTNLD